MLCLLCLLCFACFACIALLCFACFACTKGLGGLSKAGTLGGGKEERGERRKDDVKMEKETGWSEISQPCRPLEGAGIYIYNVIYIYIYIMNTITPSNGDESERCIHTPHVIRNPNSGLRVWGCFLIYEQTTCFCFRKFKKWIPRPDPRLFLKSLEVSSAAPYPARIWLQGPWFRAQIL